MAISSRLLAMVTVTCVVLVLLLHTSQALYPPRDVLSNLDGLNGFSINLLPSENMGKYLAVGDIDCDGFDDIAIVDFFVTVESKVYVKFGTAADASRSTFNVTADFSDDGSKGFIMQGTFSSSISLAFSPKYKHNDSNVQCQDLIIADSLINSQLGTLFIVKARPSTSAVKFASKTLDLFDQADTLIHQLNGDDPTVRLLGKAFTTIDFNGDGGLDYAFRYNSGSTPLITVVFGPINLPRTTSVMTLLLSAMQTHTSVTFRPTQAAHSLFALNINRGNGNNDSAQDLCFYDDGGARCILGSSDWTLSSTTPPSFTQLQPGQQWLGPKSSNRSELAPFFTGIDFNLDKIDDLVLFGSNHITSSAGFPVYVYLGAPNLSSTTQPTTLEFSLADQSLGINQYWFVNPSSGYLGFVSMDDDDLFKLPLIIGGNVRQQSASGSINRVGILYGIYGGSNSDGFAIASGQTVVNSCSHFVIDPPAETALQNFGLSSAIGDVNGDGFADILVRDVDTAWVVFGYELAPKWTPSLESMRYALDRSNLTAEIDLGTLKFTQCTTVSAEIISGAQLLHSISFVGPDIVGCTRGPDVDDFKLTIVCSVDQSVKGSSLSLVFKTTADKPLKEEITIALKYFQYGSENRLITLTDEIKISTTNAKPSISSSTTLPRSQNITPTTPSFDTVIDNAITLSDTDDTTMVSAVVAIEEYDAAKLDEALSCPTSITFDVDFTCVPQDGKLVLTGVKDIQTYQDVLSAVEYALSDIKDPSFFVGTAIQRVISFTINDGYVDSDAYKRTLELIPSCTSTSTPQGDCADGYQCLADDTDDFLCVEECTPSGTSPQGNCIAGFACVENDNGKFLCIEECTPSDTSPQGTCQAPSLCLSSQDDDFYCVEQCTPSSTSPRGNCQGDFQCLADESGDLLCVDQCTPSDKSLQGNCPGEFQCLSSVGDVDTFHCVDQCTPSTTSPQGNCPGQLQCLADDTDNFLCVEECTPSGTSPQGNCSDGFQCLSSADAFLCVKECTPSDTAPQGNCGTGLECVDDGEGFKCVEPAPIICTPSDSSPQGDCEEGYVCVDDGSGFTCEKVQEVDSEDTQGGENGAFVSFNISLCLLFFFLSLLNLQLY